MTHAFTKTLLAKSPEILQYPGIALAEALLCANCDMIYPTISETGCNTVCPGCTSGSYLKLSTILNRTSEEENIKPSEQICVQ